MIAAVQVDAITTALMVAALLGAAWMFAKGAGGTAITSLEAANRVLEARVQAQDRQIAAQDTVIAELKAQIAELQGKTDVSIVIGEALKPLFEQGDRYGRLAEERHMLTMHILQMIADRLGPDEPGTVPS